jgi:hypothetical protein
MQNYMGDNIILEKFRGLNVKLHEPGIFLELQNYFIKEKSVEYVHGAVDWVHGASPRVHNALIKRGSSRRWSTVPILFCELVHPHIILTDNHRTDGCGWAGQGGGGAWAPRWWFHQSIAGDRRPTAPSYRTRVAWQDRFTHLWGVAGSDGG